ncbi:hypothetical protein B0J11DRAFT_562589 [Dendryphion nanum]|uniref:Glucose-methanol-choline oxidoreductase N-terminal domain-containing protein n=1 Tax=Dendryphion nanum TaxID=256645 RepID=A0A9P9D1R9_9PLEO|nr:hypothetical protein B0J11DRAFT_562589 [Dendryphion nanum]
MIVTAAPPSQADHYDYVVVGSGPGGGPLASNLAQAGFRTLLLEAGDNESADPSTQVLAWSKAHLVWRLPNRDLWVGPGRSAPAGAEMLGVQYPHGATLGGSSIINSGLTVLPSDSDWNHIKSITGDASWSAEHMRGLFMKLEKNQYLPRGTPGHGFDGYLQTVAGDGKTFLSSPQATEVLESMAAEAGQNPADLPNILSTDVNMLSRDRDQITGLSSLVFHANSTWGRYSLRERVLDTLRAIDRKGNKFPLELRLNSYATKVIFDKPKVGSKPRAIGVEYLEGKSVYQGDLRYNSSNKATPRRVYARKEVILSGGSFSTPQLLLLSGIGPSADLNALKIPVVADRPGVGRNMQDHNEIVVIGQAAEIFNFDAAPGFPHSQCTYGAPGDPCYQLFLQGQGPYTEPDLNSDLAFLKTNHTNINERDIAIFAGPFAFRAEKDITAMKEFVAWGRRVFNRVKAPVGPVNITWPPCSGTVDADGSCSVSTNDEDFIRQNTFGYHVTGTCSIGPDSDKNAVLDSSFRVRGVAGLRVVDASAFPRSPGAFPVLAVFMLSEKATETILSGQ